MKRTWLMGGALAVGVAMTLCGIVLQPVQAQGQGQPGIRVAVIDVGKVFKEYSKYKSLADVLKAEIEAKENELKSMEQAMRTWPCFPSRIASRFLRTATGTTFVP